MIKETYEAINDLEDSYVQSVKMSLKLKAMSKEILIFTSFIQKTAFTLVASFFTFFP